MDVKGFLKVDGTKIVNEEGHEVLLRGVGLGGWILPEGYMWCFPEKGDRPRRIEAMIENLIGKDKSKLFWETYFERYISISDIRQIASEGFNSVRIPINARFLLEQEKPVRYNERHLQIIDRLIEWCRTYKLYVILDLHGAPGGQTGTNIDDSEFDRPDLFNIEYNRYLTIDIWRMLADRYKDEWIVAGYDLLNEPLPKWFSQYNNQVMPLYNEITKAIREVDNRHIIILEGVHWATDWSIFNEKPDDNLMLEFHKYWNNPDTESIQAYLDKREEWNVPIFMGEGGENNKEWYSGVFRLYEDHNISWNFWTWKKMDTENSPCSVIKPVQWKLLVDYLESGVKLSGEIAESILWEYLDNISFEKCVYRPEVVRSLFRRPPVLIPAVFYGYRGRGISFDVERCQEGQIEFRQHDGTDIQFVQGERTVPNFQHMKGEPWAIDEWLYVQIKPNDWLVYEINAQSLHEDCLFTMDLRMRTLHGKGRITITVDETIIGHVENIDCSWKDVKLKNSFSLKEGPHRIIIKAEEKPVCIQWIKIYKIRRD